MTSKAPPQDFFIEAAYTEYEEPWEISTAQPVIASKLLKDKILGPLPFEKNDNTTTPKRVIDVCCGVGHHSILFALQGFLVKGVDINSRAIAKAKKYQRRYDKEIKDAGGELEFICGDVLHPDEDLYNKLGSSNDILIDASGYHCFGPEDVLLYHKFLTSISKSPSSIVVDGEGIDTSGTILVFLNLRSMLEQSSGNAHFSETDLKLSFERQGWLFRILEESLYHHLPMNTTKKNNAWFALLTFVGLPP